MKPFYLVNFKNQLYKIQCLEETEVYSHELKWYGNRDFSHIRRLFNALLSLRYDTLWCILTHLGVLHYIYGMEEATECTDGKKSCSFNVHMNCFLLLRKPLLQSMNQVNSLCDSYLTVKSCHQTINPLMLNNNFNQNVVWCSENHRSSEVVGPEHLILAPTQPPVQWVPGLSRG
jgi:hypothetical protein